MAALGFVELMYRLEMVEDQNMQLRAKLARRAKKDPEDDDERDDVVNDVTDDGDEQPLRGKKKKTKKASDDVDKDSDEEEDPGRDDEGDPEGPQEGQGGDRRTKPPKDTSDQQERLAALRGDDRYRSDARYRAAVDKNVQRVLAAHAAATNRAPSKPAASVDDMIALAEHLPYEKRVKALSAAIVAADRRRRGV